MKLSKRLFLIVLLIGLTVSVDSFAADKITIKKYKNCIALNSVYRGGVAIPKAKNKGGKTKYAPTYNKALYIANKGLDRDKDNIACER